MEQQSIKLEISPFLPFIMVPFWHALSKKKLEEYKLDDSEKNVIGTYKINNYKENRANIYLDANSLNEPIKTIGQLEVKVAGYLKNCNTTEAFETESKIAIFTEKSLQFYEELKHIAVNPDQYPKITRLNTFLLATFADLKHHLFKYSLASPIFKTEKKPKISLRTSLSKAFEGKDLESFEASLKEFIVKEEDILPIVFASYKEGQYNFFTSPNTFFETASNPDNKVFAVIVDSYNQETHYGEPIYNWILLNLLRKAAGKSNISTLRIAAIKDFFVPNSQAKVNWTRSQIIEVDISEAKLPDEPVILTTASLKETKVVDLKTQLDERSLSTMAVDLNIKLMKWRLLPELNIEKVQRSKCLLFGSGTLGCQLARNLLGWGIRTISFIDYGKVTHSNPVRQSLFDFEDAQNGGKPKAETAAAKLAKIFPEVNSKGYNLEIPMPGHYAQTEEKQKKISETLDTLEELVKDHDVIFLLTDNRESRWLPTVLANKYNKICITVGLGFDTYVVVRHGQSCTEHKEEIHGERLGCYFCNDILSPHNSMKDRTLDQQCTVTRPGLSYISSAFASELFVSLLHHPLGIAAPAFDPQAKENEETCLGYLPQYVRGSCSEYDSRIFVSNAFPNCVACSDYVLQEFNSNRDEFMFKVMNDPDYLQNVTKISEVLKETEEGECMIIEDDDF